MTDPLKLAEALATDKRMIGFLGDPSDIQERLTGPQRRLLATAIRLAEARFAIDAYEAKEPIDGWVVWSNERSQILRLRVVDAARGYERARKDGTE